MSVGLDTVYVFRAAHNCAFKLHIEYSYTQMLTKLDLMPLSHRRYNFDALFIYRFINTHINSPELFGKANFNVSLRTLRNCHTFNLQDHHTNYAMYLSTSGLLKIGNELSQRTDLFRLLLFVFYCVSPMGYSICK